MIKSNPKALPYIPTSKNFSEFRSQSLDSNNTDEPLEYDLGDRGVFDETVLANLHGDELLFSLLMALDDREKIILLYQVLKEMGFGLTQEQYAKTLSFSRVYYTSLARDLRSKCLKIIQGTGK